MDNSMRALEATGTVDENGQLHLDRPIPSHAADRVRVLLLFNEDSDIDEGEWLLGAARNPAFDFLNDPAENIYSISDGKPFDDKG
jgi:hypothetical protein